MILLCRRSRCSNRRATRSPWRRRSSARGTRAASSPRRAAGVAEARGGPPHRRAPSRIPPSPTATPSPLRATTCWWTSRSTGCSAAAATARPREPASTRALADSSLAVAGLLRDVRVAFYRARASRVAEALVRAQAALADSVARLAGARLRAGDISLLEQEQAAQEAARARQTAATAREAARVAEAELARAHRLGGRAADRRRARSTRAWTSSPTRAIDLATLPTVRTAAADSAAAAAQARSAARGAGAAADAPVGRRMGRRVAAGHARRHRHRGAVPALESSAAARRAKRGPAPTGPRRSRARPGSTPCGRPRQARIHLEETAARARFARDSLLPGAAVLRGRALRAYQAGETGILPVLDALRSERDASLAAVQDQLAFQEALADWYALTGYAE